MELRHLRYFLAIVNAKSFTHAAETLGIGQPPLSMQIRDLEKEVGTELFHRVARGVELTPAGNEFYQVVKAIPELVETAKTAALKASRGESGILKVGFTTSSVFNRAVTQSVKTFSKKYPSLEMQFEETHTNMLINSVNNGTLDVAFVRTEHLAETALRLQVILHEPLVVALPMDHPLAQRSEISLHEIAAEPLIMCPQERSRFLHNTIRRISDEEGVTLTYKRTTPTVASIINLVSAGLGISIVPSSLENNASAGINVAFVKINHKNANVPLSIISRVNERSPAVNHFLKMFV